MCVPLLWWRPLLKDRAIALRPLNANHVQCLKRSPFYYYYMKDEDGNFTIKQREFRANCFSVSTESTALPSNCYVCSFLVCAILFYPSLGWGLCI